MNLSTAIEEYMAHKRSAGHQCIHTETRLCRFSRLVGNPEISKITIRHVAHYLSTGEIGPTTWRTRFLMLQHFFEFWLYKDAISVLPMPPPKAPVRPTFIPYVYSRAELRALVRATKRCQSSSKCRTSAQTLRTVIVCLYATGGRVYEVISLRCSNVDLQTGLLTIRGSGLKKDRQIPLNRDLRKIVGVYLRWRKRSGFNTDRLFVDKNGQPVSHHSIKHRFQVLRKIAGVRRRDGIATAPRLSDLRYTFAVHRITSWIRTGADMNRLLPALAAYMGLRVLDSTERYLLFAPERFRSVLDKLSPTKSSKHWRSDKKLMGFLAAL